MSTGSQALTTATASANEENPSKRQKLNDWNHLAAGCAHAVDDAVDSERSFVQSLVRASEYSDVTIYIGRARKEFKLHRVIICEKSPFFKAACKEHFKEGISRKIELPDIAPESFEGVVSWMYGGGYEIVDGFSVGIIVKTFRAADFLAISAMKTDILASLVTYTRRKHELYAANGNFELGGLITLIDALAELCPLSDFGLFKTMFMSICPNIVVDTSKIMGKNKQDFKFLNEYASAAAVDSFSTLLSNNFCAKCRHNLEMEQAKACKCCGKNLRRR